MSRYRKPQKATPQNLERIERTEYPPEVPRLPSRKAAGVSHPQGDEADEDRPLYHIKQKYARETKHNPKFSDPETQAKLEAKVTADPDVETQRKLQERAQAQNHVERMEKEKRAQAERHRREEESRRRADEDKARLAREEAEIKRQQALHRQQEERRRQKSDADKHPHAYGVNQLNPGYTDQVADDRWNKASPSRLVKQSRPPVRHENGQHPLRPSGSKELFGLFKRKRRDSKAAQMDMSGGRFGTEIRKPSQPQPNDAPVSAVNSGERHVTIEGNQSATYLPVTPKTTPVDLIQSASNTLGEPINVSASVLLENFGKVGVQRPLRKYEHVRDVMNSWDDDRQNSLILLPSATGGRDDDLESYHIPKEPPPETTVQLYYSQRPGKWDKRYATLRSDGQVVVAKKLDAKDKDSCNACHMSDYDIYSPCSTRGSKRVKPPKKLCLAVKSQQKPNMFLTTENFVHFFCTNDKKTAATWYSALQGWRSWYLVNVLGEGRSNRSGDHSRHKGGQASAEATIGFSNAQQNSLKKGSDTSPYNLDAFKPLIADERLASSSSPNEAIENSNGSSAVRRNLSTSQRAGTRGGAKPSRGSGDGPPTSFPKHFSNDELERTSAKDWPNTHARSSSRSSSMDRSRSIDRIGPQDEQENNAFAPSGLLGRTYSQRQKAAQPAEATAGRRPSTDPNKNDLSSLARTHSRVNPANKPKPLLDFTPTYTPPPQHQRKGKGYHPGQDELALGDGALIGAARNLDKDLGMKGIPDVPRANDPWVGRQKDGGRSARPAGLDLDNSAANENKTLVNRAGGGAPGIASVVTDAAFVKGGMLTGGYGGGPNSPTGMVPNTNGNGNAGEDKGALSRTEMLSRNMSQRRAKRV
ncbi:MAG: hypothetical protein M1831_001343 [Alyxoria varia]|nr:MAG: hypothetical protein M1831_001343 [Alyxoria varia]